MLNSNYLFYASDLGFFWKEPVSLKAVEKIGLFWKIFTGVTPTLVNNSTVYGLILIIWS